MVREYDSNQPMIEKNLFSLLFGLMPLLQYMPLRALAYMVSERGVDEKIFTHLLLALIL
jgi:hypothetical protein